MTIIITTDVERAARRTDRTLRIGESDVVGPEARALAERLGVRIVRANGDVLVAPPAAPPPVTPPPVSPAAPSPSPPSPHGVAPPPPPLAPAPNPVEVLRRLREQSAGGQPRESGPVSPVPPPRLPIEQYGAGRVTDPVQEIGRPTPRPASPPPIRFPSEVSSAPAAEPAATATVLPVQRIPVATPAEPPAAAAPSPVAPPPSPTLISSRRPPTYRQRRRAARIGAPPSQMGIILGRIIDSREVRRAAEQGVRLVRVAPEAYITRAARRAAAVLGVVLYPDSSLNEVDDRTKAGTVLNPISLEPAITRRGPGIVHPGGLPIGGDHLPGTLGVEEKA
ncbi:MAG: hypothetical protein RMM58_09385 [Chloroflexota bacterium]|nr:hypothetical protein [Dehalococcoidia bacterium]MDW8254079.1 hypothetical protein [Chloroflexota bacterium]